MNYHSRLKKINLESLELRRLRADLVLVYKIMFGMIRLNGIDFSLRNLWNNLPTDTTVLTSLHTFCSSLTKYYLFRFCVVNFTWCLCWMRFYCLNCLYVVFVVFIVHYIYCVVSLAASCKTLPSPLLYIKFESKSYCIVRRYSGNVYSL